MRYYGWDDYDHPSMMGGGMTRMVKILILVNVGVFLLQIASAHNLTVLFGLSPQLVFGRFFIWQFVTYMFLHGGVWHIAINMFILWMFGRELEAAWGDKAFLRYYLICGIGGGIATYLFTMGSPVITIGASGAIFGVLVAYAVLFPDRMITLLLFFIFPITLKAKHLVMIFAGLELLQCIAGAEDGIGHFAHLGGAVVGYIYLRIWRKRSLYGTSSEESLMDKLRERFGEWKQKKDEDVDEEVDRILEKISKTGLESLTRREKSILRRKASRK